VAFVAQCDLCEWFLESKRRQAEAEETLQRHLRDYHNVRPSIVLYPPKPAPFVRIANFIVSDKESKDVDVNPSKGEEPTATKLNDK
jgi:hypothetical protein